MDDSDCGMDNLMDISMDISMDIPDEPIPSRPYSFCPLFTITSLLPLHKRMLALMETSKHRFQDRLKEKSSNELEKVPQLMKRSKQEGTGKKGVKLISEQSSYSSLVSPRQIVPTNVENIGGSTGEVVNQALEASLYNTLKRVSRYSTREEGPLCNIMLKLVQIIDKNGRDDRGKGDPIIINNILKNPTETVDRELMHREIKIQLLQQLRQKGQSHKRGYEPKEYESYNKDMMASRNSHFISRNDDFTKMVKEVPITSEHKNIGEKCQASRHGSRTVSVASVSTNRTYEDKPNNAVKNEVDADSKVELGIEAKPASEVKMLASEVKMLASEVKVVEAKPQPPVVRRSVLMQISFAEDNNRSMSLAQAFKLKVGKLSSERPKQPRPSPKKIPVRVDLPGDFHEPTPAPALQYRKRAISKASDNAQRKVTARSVQEPSKELMDRLTDGKRAQVSKEEMYALTKKNYEKLPEVEARRNEQVKRQEEQARLQKLRQFQRFLRKRK